MKNVLVTGAAGTIGLEVVKSLLTESKYNITALDLKFKNSVKRLKKYGKRIEFVFGDITNQKLMEKLVEDKDIIIHLAAIMPPLADIKPELSRIINFFGTKTLVDAINKNNPKCFLLFASSSSVYGQRYNDYWISKEDKTIEIENDNYAKNKIEAENYIKNELKNYSIFRLTATVSKVYRDPIIFNMSLKSKLEIITVKDASYAFVKAVDHFPKLKGKVYNLGGGEKCRTTYIRFLKELLKIHGLNFRYIRSLILDEKNYYCGYYKDSDELEAILNYRTDTLTSYYRKIRQQSNKFSRLLPKIFSYPIVLILDRKEKNYGKKETK